MHTLLGRCLGRLEPRAGPHLVSLIELKEGEGRRRTTAEVIADLESRSRLLSWSRATIAQPRRGRQGERLRASVAGPRRPPGGRCARREPGTLRGVRDVRTDLESGKRQVTLRLAEAGRQVGLGESDLAAQVRTAFEGREVASLRRGSEDVDVMVKYPEDRREIRGALRDLRVALPSAPGESPARVPLHRVAHLDEGTGPSSVGHEERLRAVVVSADVDETTGNAAQIRGARCRAGGGLRRPAGLFLQASRARGGDRRIDGGSHRPAWCRGC